MVLALEGIDDWSYDAFELNEAADGRPLSALAFCLIQRQGIITCLGLDAAKLARLVRDLMIQQLVKWIY